jgi:hypothetical protein
MQNDINPTQKNRLPLGRSAERNARTFLNQAQEKAQKQAKTQEQAIVRDPISSIYH